MKARRSSTHVYIVCDTYPLEVSHLPTFGKIVKMPTQDTQTPPFLNSQDRSAQLIAVGPHTPPFPQRRCFPWPFFQVQGPLAACIASWGHVWGKVESSLNSPYIYSNNFTESKVQIEFFEAELKWWLFEHRLALPQKVYKIAPEIQGVEDRCLLRPCRGCILLFAPMDERRQALSRT